MQTNAATPSGSYPYLATSPALSPPAAGQSPAQHRPSPVPSRSIVAPASQYSAAPGQPYSSRPQRGHSVVSSSRAAAADDPILEARKTLALLLGTGNTGDGGLLAKLEKEYSEVMQSREMAFEGGTSRGGTSPQQLLQTSAHILSLLSSSSVGAFPLQQPVVEPALLQRVETASAQAQQLFRDRQRMKEGAEIASSIIGSS